MNRYRTLFRTALAVLALLSLILPSASAQITPDQAVQAVRDYWKDPSIQGKVSRLKPEDEGRRNGLYYYVEVINHLRAGVYIVRAADGQVTAFFLPTEGDDSRAPQLTRSEAREIALRFLRERYPSFFQLRWDEAPEWLLPNGPRFGFHWTRILNAYGTLAPHGLEIHVDGVDGRVIQMSLPPDRPLNCSVVPRVTAAQALQIASRYAPVDVAVLPFHDWQLKVWEDHYGINRLVWLLHQRPQWERDPSYRYSVAVDAHSGQFLERQLPLSQPSKPLRPVPALPAPAAVIVTGGGAKLQPSIAPVVQSGVLWVRVEALRGLGAVVQADGRGVEIVVGERRLCGSAAGAERRGLGWWVPLRRVSESLGWRVEWRHKTREAVVFTQESR
jgi:hypothetical protein